MPWLIVDEKEAVNLDKFTRLCVVPEYPEGPAGNWLVCGYREIGETDSGVEVLITRPTSLKATIAFAHLLKAIGDGKQVIVESELVCNRWPT